jgi:peptidoglycan/LPS O-acetylase OafA/YrhL
MAKGRLEGLDALRGIAALSVLVYHVSGSAGSSAYLAVDFFFMLSGYVMARTYEPRLGTGMPAWQFISARFMRLWPTMFLAGLIALPWLFTWAPTRHAWVIAAANLLLIPNLTQNRVYVLNGPAWSILYELLANAFHALGLWRLTNRQLFALLALLAVTMAWLASRFGYELGSRPATLLGGIPRVLLSYGAGMLLWRVWQDVPAFKVPGLVTLAGMPVFFIGSALAGSLLWQADVFFVLVVCPLLMAGGLRLQRVHPALVWLGFISFPLYAVHSPVMHLAKLLGSSPLVGGLASIPVAWGLAHLAPRFAAGLGKLARAWPRAKRV